MAELFDVRVERRWPLSAMTALSWGLARGRGCQRMRCFIDARGDGFVGLRLLVKTTHSDARVGFDNVFVSRVLDDGLTDRSLFASIADLLRGDRAGGFGAAPGGEVPVLIARAEYQPGPPDSPVSGGLRDAAVFDVLVKEEVAASLGESWTSTAWPGVSDDTALPLLTGPDDLPTARADAAWFDACAWVDAEGAYQCRPVDPLPGVLDAAVRADGAVFLATTAGLVRAEPGGWRPVHLGKKKAKQDAQCVAVVGELAFVGTYRNGLFIVHADGEVENVPGGKGKPLPSRNVVSLAPYVDGGVIVGLRDAVVHRAADGTITELPFPDGKVVEVLTDEEEILCRLAGRRGGAYHAMAHLGGEARLRADRWRDLRRTADGSLRISFDVHGAEGPFVGGDYTTTAQRSPWSLSLVRGVVVHAGTGAYAIEHPPSVGFATYFEQDRPQATLSRIAANGDFVVLAGPCGAVRISGLV